MEPKHYLLFDGTSYFVSDCIEDECEYVNSSYNLDRLQDEADILNDI